MLLGIVTKNGRGDVGNLLNSGILGLDEGHFVGIMASWDPKPLMIAHLLEQLNVGPESLIFIDDNPSEVVEVASQFPSAFCILAQDGDATPVLDAIPGTWHFGSDQVAGLRQASTTASSKVRTELSALDPQGQNAYLAGLRIVAQVRQAEEGDASRIASLVARTNQFNVTLKRTKEFQIVGALQDPNVCTVVGSMRDILADSGNVAVAVFRRQSHALELEEFCVSCRALGRGYEDAFFRAAAQIAMEKLGSFPIHIQFCEGDRNEPASRWVKQVLSGHFNGELSPQQVSETNNQLHIRVEIGFSEGA